MCPCRFQRTVTSSVCFQNVVLKGKILNCAAKSKQSGRLHLFTSASSRWSSLLLPQVGEGLVDEHRMLWSSRFHRGRERRSWNSFRPLREWHGQHQARWRVQFTLQWHWKVRFTTWCPTHDQGRRLGEQIQALEHRRAGKQVRHGSRAHICQTLCEQHSSLR